MLRNLLAAGFAAVLPFQLQTAHAQDATNYPDKPVTLVVSYVPGGSNDIVARAIGAKLADKFGQTFIVENKPGAAGVVGADSVAKAPPDGYRLLVQTSNMAIYPAMYSDLPFDSRKDFIPVSIIAEGPFSVMANNDLPANNIKELIDYAKRNPGKINFASSGIGSTGHLLAELLKRETGTDMVHIPFKGGGESQMAVMSDEVQFVFETLTVLPIIKEKRAKALAVTSKTRLPELPDVMTMGEAGIKELDGMTTWIAAYAPAGTPQPIVDKLSAAIAEAVKDPGVVDQFKKIGFTEVGSSSSEAKDRLQKDVDIWTDLAASGVKIK